MYYSIMESSTVYITSVNNQTIFDSMSPEHWLLHQPDSCHPEPNGKWLQWALYQFQILHLSAEQFW